MEHIAVGGGGESDTNGNERQPARIDAARSVTARGGAYRFMCERRSCRRRQIGTAAAAVPAADSPRLRDDTGIQPAGSCHQEREHRKLHTEVDADAECARRAQ